MKRAKRGFSMKKKRMSSDVADGGKRVTLVEKEAQRLMPKAMLLCRAGRGKQK